MVGFEFTIMLIVSSALVGYACYVFALMVRADFYSPSQKIAQTLLVLLLPLIGAAIVHWFLLLHRAKPDTSDRAFIPQDGPAPDEIPRRPHIDGI